eukprot:CAMPEP_0174924014 /NCGR_PEP_ID=MMETSP1355-20121228/6964_1 /TAXON_ID=464990 /ORGANISM="Hemiselmis tepida, Strain CCMP443" /LENGTH=197 /DNA_ID=CAMNT_0016169757 /DNA_START=246 /DNA_END=835 /DNA_ORIENTATION=-
MAPPSPRPSAPVAAKGYPGQTEGRVLRGLREGGPRRRELRVLRVASVSAALRARDPTPVQPRGGGTTQHNAASCMTRHIRHGKHHKCASPVVGGGGDSLAENAIRVSVGGAAPARSATPGSPPSLLRGLLGRGRRPKRCDPRVLGSSIASISAALRARGGGGGLESPSSGLDSPSSGLDSPSSGLECPPDAPPSARM